MKRRSAVRLAIFAALLHLGCGPSGGVTVATTLPVNGHWLGRTDQGEFMTMTTRGGVIRALSLSLRLPTASGGTCRFISEDPSTAQTGIYVQVFDAKFRTTWTNLSSNVSESAMFDALITGTFPSPRMVNISVADVRYRNADCGPGPATITGSRAGVQFTLQPVPTMFEFLDTCPTSEEVSRIDSEVRIDFSGDPTRSRRPACPAAPGGVELSRLQQRMYQALLLMQRIEFDGPLPWTTRATLYEWFVRAVRGVRLTPDRTFLCCSPTGVIHVAGVHGLYDETGVFDSEEAFEFPDWRAANMVQFIGLMLYMARYAEGIPNACATSDKTIAEGGAAAVQYSFMLFLANRVRAPWDTFLSPVRAWTVERARRTCAGGQAILCDGAASGCPDPYP